MKLLIIQTIIAIALLIAALEYMPQANAQTTDQLPQGELQSDSTDKSDPAIVDSLQDEEPPPPEAPYPGANEEGFSQEDNSQQAPTVDNDILPPAQDIQTLEQPIKKDKNGTYYYGVKESGRSGAASFRFGMFGPPKIVNPKNGLWFHDIYEAENIPTVFFDYEWDLKTFLGDLGVKLGSGIFFASGKGHFADPARQYDTPPENFTFLMLPNTASAIYRLKFSDKQPILPYAEAGAGYFTFMEFGDDGRAPKFAGAPATFVAGGAAILLDWFDTKAIRDLDREYGINHVYLTAEYREVIGFTNYDFTSRVIGGGMLFDF